jgi:hypothetical protein
MSASINANANVVGTPNGQGGFNYTITLNDTGSTTLGTFWFSWIPGQDFMTQNPSLIGSPAGWSESVVPIGSGYSIEWTANSSVNYVQPAGSSSAFTFTSAETPAQLAAHSTLNPIYPTTTSFVYSGRALVSSGLQITPTVSGASPPVENATATLSPLQISPGVFQYTIALTDTGNTAVHTFWFAWDDVPDQDFMSRQPTSVGSPTGWTDTVTTHLYPGGTGYGIEWTATSSSADLNPTDTNSSFTFTSTETPVQFASVSPFDNTFQSTSSFVYSGGAEQTAGGNFVVAVACFREGTRIRTPSGDVAVESLRPGDSVITASGEFRPVRWTGRRRVVCQRHPHPELLWPIRVAACALGLDTPGADLLLSPDHALFLDGVLVPVKHLINGTTIAAMPVDAVTWHHLELDSHDVILAEGAPAETYLDTGDRAKFEGEVMLLFPDAAIPGRTQIAREANSGMRLVVTGPILASIRHRLADRAVWLAEASQVENSA